MAVGGSNHAVSTGSGPSRQRWQWLRSAILAANGNGVAGCQWLRELSGVDPSVDVHVGVEFLGSVAQDQRKDAAEGIGFPVAHDEFPFIVANRAVGA